MIDVDKWNPSYTLRKSRRAKQISLQISTKHGLVVVVPEKSKNFNIQEILTNKRSWIEKNLSRFPSIIESPLEKWVYPPSLSLPGIRKTLQLNYLKTNHPLIKIKRLNIHAVSPYENPIIFPTPAFEPGSIKQINPPMLNIQETSSIEHYQIFGAIDQKHAVIKAVKRILKKIAELYLIPWLTQLSMEVDLPYSKVSLRWQSTLWGSCSAAKIINLNIKLLFLPAVLTRYVLLHELCHIQHLNHSKKFWNLLKQFDPECPHHKQALRFASQYLPVWLDN